MPTMYAAYYKMADMSPDLPVWVEAHNWCEAVQLFQKWRDRKETEGYGYLISTQPIKVESDEDTLNPTFGSDPRGVSTIRS